MPYTGKIIKSGKNTSAYRGYYNANKANNNYLLTKGKAER